MSRLSRNHVLREKHLTTAKMAKFSNPPVPQIKFVSTGNAVNLVLGWAINAMKTTSMSSLVKIISKK